MKSSFTSMPPLPIECGRRHRHTTDEQVTECDRRLVRREQMKLEAAAKREMESIEKP